MPVFLTSNNLQIHYSDNGKGCPVVLLHGFGEDGNIYQRQVEALQYNYRIIVPNLPGSGLSMFDANTCSSIDAMADVLHEFITSVTSEKVVLLGHSMGGYITLAYAEKHSYSLKAMGLLHSTAFADSDEKKQMRKKSMEFIKENGSYLFLKTSIPGLFGETFQQQHSEEIETLIEKGKSFLPEALMAYYEAMIGRPNSTQVFKNATVPVLFIIGAVDKAAPMADVLQQVYLAQTSHVHILQKTAHMGMLEETEMFNQHLADFLSNVC